MAGLETPFLEDFRLEDPISKWSVRRIYWDKRGSLCAERYNHLIFGDIEAALRRHKGDASDISISPKRSSKSERLFWLDGGADLDITNLRY